MPLSKQASMMSLPTLYSILFGYIFMPSGTVGLEQTFSGMTNSKGQNEISDYKLSCSDIISAFLWLTNALSFGLLPSTIRQTMNKLVSVQLKTSKANKLLMISIIVLPFVDLELEGKCRTLVEGSRNKQQQEKMSLRPLTLRWLLAGGRGFGQPEAPGGSWLSRDPSVTKSSSLMHTFCL